MVSEAGASAHGGCRVAGPVKQAKPSIHEFCRLLGADADHRHFPPLVCHHPILFGVDPMRVDIPLGYMWLPYYSRRLRERPENILCLPGNLVRR